MATIVSLLSPAAWQLVRQGSIIKDDLGSPRTESPHSILEIHMPRNPIHKLQMTEDIIEVTIHNKIKPWPVGAPVPPSKLTHLYTHRTWYSAESTARKIVNSMENRHFIKSTLPDLVINCHNRIWHKSLNLLLLCQATVLSTTVVPILHVDSMGFLVKTVFMILIIKSIFYSIISMNYLSFLKYSSSWVLCYHLLWMKLQENSEKRPQLGYTGKHGAQETGILKYKYS